MFEFLQDPAKQEEFEDVDVFDEDGRKVGTNRRKKFQPQDETRFDDSRAPAAAKASFTPEQSQTIARRQATDRVLDAFEAVKRTIKKPLGGSAYAMMQEQQDPQRNAPPGRDPGVLADPSSAARIAEQLYGVDTSRPEFKSLEDAVRLYQQTISQPLERDIRGQLSAGDISGFTKSVAATQKEIARLQAEKQRIVGAGPVSERQASEFKEKTASIDAAIQANMEALNAQRGAVGEAAKNLKPYQPDAPNAQDMSILGIQPDQAAIDPNPANRQTSALNMLGNKNYEMLFDVMEDIGGKTGRRSDQPAYGPAALEYVVRNAQTMGLITPEMAGAFALQLKALSGLDTPEKKAAAQESGRSYQSGEEAKQVEGQIDEKRKEHKNKVQELFEAEELQSWGSILAYVVMSLFIGPRMAFLFFSNAQKKGMLKYELEQIKTDGRKLSEAKALKEREAREARANAANLMLRGEVKQDDRRWQAMREQMAREQQNAQRLAEIEARAAASGRKDADLENLKTKIKGYENQARLAASRFDFEASEAYAEAAADLLQRIETAYGEK